MKTLFLDCSMGAAGDMLTAALYELLDDKPDFIARMNALPLPGVRVEAEAAQKCGISGTHMRVTVRGEEEDAPRHDHHHDAHDHPHEHKHHHHRHCTYQGVAETIETLPVPEDVRRDAAAVYRLIGEAESRAHGAPIEQIHFHEVGSLDAVADVVGFCLALHLIGPDRVVASPVRVGFGAVQCAHGVLPVPAPATADILRGVPAFAGDIEGEMCTPTGAALLRHFAAAFEPMPVLATERIGYGMGSRDYGAANCVRAFLGAERREERGDEVVELRCNLDDCSPETLGFAASLLLEAGALDVFTTPIQMKKSRPGVLLTVLCRPQDEEQMSLLLLRHTTTRGVRRSGCRRRKLDSAFESVSTPYGNVRIKVSTGWGVRREKPEYEDVAAAARAAGVPLDKVAAAARAAWAHGKKSGDR